MKKKQPKPVQICPRKNAWGCYVGEQFTDAYFVPLVIRTRKDDRERSRRIRELENGLMWACDTVREGHHSNCQCIYCNKSRELQKAKRPKR